MISQFIEHQIHHNTNHNLLLIAVRMDIKYGVTYFKVCLKTVVTCP